MTAKPNDPAALSDLELAVPPLPQGLTNRQILVGPAITPMQRISLYSEGEFETFIEEWAYGSLRAQYARICNCSGGGDMGRDVIGYVSQPVAQSDWDNYQCKHYDHPLMPSDIWLELGKLCYFTHAGMYTVPRRYYFVAPRNVGPSVNALFERPEDLRRGLVDAWETHCERAITRGAAVPLRGALAAHVRAFDFSRVGFLPILEVIAGHRETVYHATRFGGGLTRPRPQPPQPPAHITPEERRYVKQLLDAYADHLNVGDLGLQGLKGHDRLARHFARCREHFFRAESLRQFSRDAAPDEGCFLSLREEIYAGVVDTAEGAHQDGYSRVCATTTAAAQLQITSHVLLDYLQVGDRHGICHQLANDDRLTWVP